MKVIMRRLLALFLLMVSAFAYAATCTEYQPMNNGNAVGTWHASKGAACAELRQIRADASGGLGSQFTVVSSDPTCVIKQNTFTYSPEGYGQRENPNCNVCAPKSGQSQIVDWTLGYSRSYAIGDDNLVAPPSKLPSAGLICSAGCQMSGAYPSAIVAAWKSGVPTSEGLYRLSVDVNTTYTGEACVQTDAPADATVPNPPCVGSLGEVNGKPFCAGTAASPTANDKPSDVPLPPTAGNPQAGPKPETGEGSGTGGAGRTPSTGNGGSGGGPAAAAGAGGVATGADGTGTVPKPADGKEQANCGAPGQPQCKIDETGTPTDASGKFNDANSKLGSAMDSIKGSIEGVKDIAAPTWTWSFQLPTGCTPFPMWDGVTIDMCQYQTTIHDLMSMIWLLTTAWACIAIVGRTVGQGG